MGLIFIPTNLDNSGSNQAGNAMLYQANLSQGHTPALRTLPSAAEGTGFGFPIDLTSGSTITKTTNSREGDSTPSRSVVIKKEI